jgi:PAS domain S-box-containing protein
MIQERSTAEQLFVGKGEMARRMRSYDWSQTTLGSVETWSQNLKTAIRIVLTSNQPMFVWWGEDLVNLYNDAYSIFLRSKHPAALGQPASHVWQEIWHQVEPRVESTIRQNEGMFDEALLSIVERNGFSEETYVTFSYSPIPDEHSKTGGILCTCTDKTDRIIGKRQLALLQELAANAADARTFDQAYTLSAKCLETNLYDFPFAMIYRVDADQQRIVLAGTSGIDRSHPAVSEVVHLDAESVWSFSEVIQTQKPVLVSDLATRLSNLPTGAWDRAPDQAIAVPIAPSGQTGRSGILVAGLNPLRPVDENYRSFINLVAGQISASVAHAHAYEEERKRAEALAELDRATLFSTDISERQAALRDRQQAEEQLRESEKFLQAINEAAPNLLYIFDLNERRNVYVSPQISPMLGVLPADVQILDSQLFVELFHPDDLEQIRQHHDRIQATREDDIFTIEYRMKHSSGKWLWLSSRDTIFVRDDQGLPTQILGSAIDITDRKQAEMMLTEQKRLLELVAINTPLNECLSAVCVSISELNPRIRACFLITNPQGSTFSQSITPDFPPSLEQGVKDLPINDLCIGTCGEAVYRGQPIACADIANDDRWSQDWRNLCIAHGILACHSSPVFGIERSPFGSLMLCFSEARTPTNWEYQLAEFGTQIASIAFERDRSSLALRESEQKYRSLFESIDQGFCLLEVLFDADEKPFDYRFVEINEAFEQQSGLTNAVRKTILELVPSLEPQWVEHYAQVVKSGEASRFEANVVSMNRVFDIYAFPSGCAVCRYHPTQTPRSQSRLFSRDSRRLHSSHNG